MTALAAAVLAVSFAAPTQAPPRVVVHAGPAEGVSDSERLALARVVAARFSMGSGAETIVVDGSAEPPSCEDAPPASDPLDPAEVAPPCLARRPGDRRVVVQAARIDGVLVVDVALLSAASDAVVARRAPRAESTAALLPLVEAAADELARALSCERVEEASRLHPRRVGLCPDAAAPRGFAFCDASGPILDEDMSERYRAATGTPLLQAQDANWTPLLWGGAAVLSLGMGATGLVLATLPQATPADRRVGLGLGGVGILAGLLLGWIAFDDLDELRLAPEAPPPLTEERAKAAVERYNRSLSGADDAACASPR